MALHISYGLGATAQMPQTRKDMRMQRIDLGSSRAAIGATFCVGLCTLALGCATHLPVILTHDSAEPVSKVDVVSAGVHVLQQRGYNLAMVNENVGVLTTEWADDTSVGTEIFSILTDDKVNHRKQVGVSVSPDSMAVTVTVTRQEQHDNSAWSNQEPSDDQREEADAILGEILAYVAPPQ